MNKKQQKKKYSNDFLNCQNFVLLKKRTIKSKDNNNDDSSRNTQKNNKNDVYLEGIIDNKGFIYKWINYNQFEKYPTKIPDGFKNVSKKYLSKEYINSQKCGNKKNISDIDWDTNIHSGYQIYYTLYGTQKPFLVAIKNKLVKVYAINQDIYYPPNQEKCSYHYNDLVGEYYPDRIFIGKSPKTNSTIGTDSYGSKYNGNSILLKIKNNKYIFIGYDIYQFDTEDEITYFISPILRDRMIVSIFGNHPCPFAIGKNNVYDMNFQRFIPLKYFSDISKKDLKYYMYEYFDEDFGNLYMQDMMNLKHIGINTLTNKDLYQYLKGHIERYDLKYSI